MGRYSTYCNNYNLDAKKLGRGIVVFFFSLCCSLYSSQIHSQENETTIDAIESYDIVPIEIAVGRYIRFETDAIISDKKLVYLI